MADSRRSFGAASYRRMMATGGELLRLEEVAEIARVSVSTVRHWIKAGKLASLRPGRRRLVRRTDLERFLLADEKDHRDAV